MKRYIQMVPAIVAITIGNMAHAWDYTFINKEAFFIPKMGIRIQFSGYNEPWYYGVTTKSTALGDDQYTFQFGANKQANLNLEGTQKEFTGRKAGFCLIKVEMMPYVNNKGTLQPTNKWIPCAIASVDRKGWNQMKTAMGSFNVATLKGWAIKQSLKPNDISMCRNRTFIISAEYDPNVDEMDGNTVENITITYEKD